jgi:hypothetical protein
MLAGGFIGTYAFQPMSKEIGLSGVFIVCSALSVLGVAVTHAFVKPYFAGFCHDTRQRQESMHARKGNNMLELPLIDAADEIGAPQLSPNSMPTPSSDLGPESERIKSNAMRSSSNAMRSSSNAMRINQ